MRAQPLAPDPVEDSIEFHLASHARRTGGLYLVLALIPLAGIAALPLIVVNVTAEARGMVRPVLEKQEITAPAPGFVVATALASPGRVRAGDTLLLLRSDLEERHRRVRARIAERSREVRDLQRLSEAAPELEVHQLREARYRGELAVLQAELAAIRRRESRAEREVGRASALLQRGFSSLAEVEAREDELKRTRLEAVLLLERSRGRWAAELAAARAAMEESRAEADRLADETRRYALLAPVAGTVEEAVSLSPGSYVQAGQRLAVVSPLSRLVAEVHLSARDVALLRPGAPARIEVDALPSTDWGLVSGYVEEVADDFTLVGGQPMFRVRIGLRQAHLTLRGGQRGELRKGMTVTARFRLSRRSLWQLLRHGVRDRLVAPQAALPVVGR